jgi:cell division protein FtsL
VPPNAWRPEEDVVDHAETFEYAIRKDVRNTTIVREVDERRMRELWASLAVGVGLVLVVMFSAWQHFEHIRHGYEMELMQKQRLAEEDVRQHLRLELETLRAPQRIEKIATERLGMIAPSSDDAVVLERVLPVEPPARSVVAAR